MMYVIPLDYLFVGLSKLRRRLPLRAISAILVLGMYFFARGVGIFHGYLFYQMTRYGAAVSMTNRIIDKIPKQMFTVVSTTEELYQVIEHGYHEEILTLLNHMQDPTYTLPTPYVFVFIEKKSIEYAHSHFVGGPSWLAEEKYAEMSPDESSQCPDIRCAEISPEDAAKDIKYGAKLSDTSTDLEGRTILESKLYYDWYQKLSRIYPKETSVIYEDEGFLCLCIVQNPESLFSLGGM